MEISPPPLIVLVFKHDVFESDCRKTAVVVVNNLSGLLCITSPTPHGVKYNSISASAWANTVKQVPIFWKALGSLRFSAYQLLLTLAPSFALWFRFFGKHWNWIFFFFNRTHLYCDMHLTFLQTDLLLFTTSGILSLLLLSFICLPDEMALLRRYGHFTIIIILGVTRCCAV